MNEDVMNPGATGMIVNEKMKDDLRTAAKWAKFLCIMQCIGVVLLVILAIAMIALGNSVSSMVPGGAPGFGTFTGIVYLILVAIYLYPLVKGFQFANATKAACLNNDEKELARGFEGMRSWLVFYGILTIVSLVLLVLGLIFLFVVGAAIGSQL